tara:strand:- start:372 stop:947 length:576 start_codon:yes stop_codon:yes gene_type:complete
MSKEIDKVIHQRRAVYPKHYSDETISKKTILQILENANMAPTHKYTQPWLFKIFSKDSRLKLGIEMVSEYKKKSQDSVKNQNLKEKKILDKCNKSKFIIAICMKRDDKSSIPEWEEIAATSMAVQNMWLTCTARNIGCYWSTPKFANKLNEFLGLNKNEKCLGFFYLGKFQHKNLKKTRRDNINKKIKWMD